MNEKSFPISTFCFQCHYSFHHYLAILREELDIDATMYDVAADYLRGSTELPLGEIVAAHALLEAALARNLADIQAALREFYASLPIQEDPGLLGSPASTMAFY